MIGKNTKIFLIISVAYLAIALSALGWVLFKVDDLGRSMEAQVSVIADSLAQDKALTELEDLVGSSDSMRTSLEHYVLTEDDTIDFLTNIENIGTQQGVKLETSSLRVVESEGVFDTLVIKFFILGNEDRLFNMIKIFETLPYHSSLKDVQLHKSVKGESASLSVTLAVSLIKV